jgi:hypothetical protein
MFSLYLSVAKLLNDAFTQIAFHFGFLSKHLLRYIVFWLLLMSSRFVSCFRMLIDLRFCELVIVRLTNAHPRSAGITYCTPVQVIVRLTNAHPRSAGITYCTPVQV